MPKPNSREKQNELKVWLTVNVPQARDFFELLGVHKGSTIEEIGARRSELARLLHPDRWEVDLRRKGQAADAMATVNMAHTMLTVKDKRLRYLAELATGRNRCPTCQGEGYTRKQRGFKNVERISCNNCGGSGLYAARKGD